MKCPDLVNSFPLFGAARRRVSRRAFLLATAPAWATSSSTLSNGAQLAVDLTGPASGSASLVADGATGVDVPVAGTASIGKGAPNVHWTYVIDVSGSTGLACGQAGGTVLDCEKAAVRNLDDAVVHDGSAVDVGLSVFAAQGATGDMSPDPAPSGGARRRAGRSCSGRRVPTLIG